MTDLLCNPSLVTPIVLLSLPSRNLPSQDSQSHLSTPQTHRFCTSTGDWLHVDDHCAALATLLEHPGIEGETFNIGANHELDVLTITATILELLNKPKSLIRHVEDRPGHDRRYAVDCSKIQKRTGWKPTISFADGIRRTVDWFLANGAWWRAIKQGEFREYYKRMYGQRKALKEVRG